MIAVLTLSFTTYSMSIIIAITSQEENIAKRRAELWEELGDEAARTKVVKQIDHKQSSPFYHC